MFRFNMKQRVGLIFSIVFLMLAGICGILPQILGKITLSMILATILSTAGSSYYLLYLLKATEENALQNYDKVNKKPEK